MGDRACQPFVSDCQVRAVVELLSHTWDAVVLSALRTGPVRRADLIERVAGISDKVLTDSLRRLLQRELIIRQAEPGSAVYCLTGLGASFTEGPLAHLARWAADNQDALAATS